MRRGRGRVSLGRGKFIIQMSNEQLPSYVAANLSAMEASADFDGIVIGGDYLDPTFGTVHFKEYLWQDYAIPYADLSSNLAALQSLSPTKFLRNFIRVNGASPGTVDVFNAVSMAKVVANFGTAAKLAFNGGMKGIFLDWEAYAPSTLFDFRTMAGHTFAEYQAQYRAVGNSIMSAMQTQFPGIHIFLSFGYYQATRSGEDLSIKTYGLYPSLLDGMFDACAGRTRITDGMELSFGWQSNNDDWNYGDSLQFSPPNCNSSNYAAYALRGKSTWIDYEQSTRGWDQVTHSNNYNSPAQFAINVVKACVHSDMYIWVYNQVPKWFVGGATPMPAAYVSALSTARAIVSTRG